MATASKTTKGFKVTCPFCGGDEDTPLRIDLTDLSAITCGNCDETFTAKAAVAKATEQMKRWEAVARWVEMAGEALNENEAE